MEASRSLSPDAVAFVKREREREREREMQKYKARFTHFCKNRRKLRTIDDHSTITVTQTSHRKRRGDVQTIGQIAV